MIVDICPRCESDQVLGKKFGFGDGELHERYCQRCGLMEDRRSSDADLQAWFARWQREVPDAPAPPPPADAELDALLARVVRAPGDDEPRLSYADRIAATRSERAELIRLQVHRARDERTARKLHGEPSPREAALLDRHAVEWARHVEPYARPYAYDAPYRGWTFERGFVAQLRTDPDLVIDRARTVFEAAPIEHLDLTGDGPVRDALVSPNLAGLRSIGLHDLGLTDADVVAFAAAGHLGRCEWLDLRNNRIDWDGVVALVTSPIIRAIPIVLLGGNPCDPAVQFADDHGSDPWLPEVGKLLEEQHGRVDWFHLPHRLPDRYHARSVTYLP